METPEFTWWDFLIQWCSLESAFLLQHVIRAQRAINNEMAHQLYVLQVLTFNLLEDRMMTKMDPQDQVSIWHDLVRTGRGQLLVAVRKTLDGGKDTGRNSYPISLTSVVMLDFIFWLLEDELAIAFHVQKYSKMARPFSLACSFMNWVWCHPELVPCAYLQRLSDMVLLL